MKTAHKTALTLRQGRGPGRRRPRWICLALMMLSLLIAIGGCDGIVIDMNATAEEIIKLILDYLGLLPTELKGMTQEMAEAKYMEGELTAMQTGGIGSPRATITVKIVQAGLDMDEYMDFLKEEEKFTVTEDTGKTSPDEHRVFKAIQKSPLLMRYITVDWDKNQTCIVTIDTENLVY